MLKVGITGGIGSGKTTVCHIFETLGVPVYNADLKAKSIINENRELRALLIHGFGLEVFKDGQYNAPYISKIVFENKTKLAELNAIIHPFVFNEWGNFCIQHANENYVIKEAAIMLETESKNTVDVIVLVSSPLDMRIERLKKRDHFDEQSIMKRIANQMDEDSKRKLANYIIENNEKDSLIIQVLELHKKFKTLGKLS